MGVRENYQEKVDAQLQEWQDWIRSYKNDLPASDRAARSYGDTASRQRWIARLDDSHQNAQNRLGELRSSNEAHWELSKQAVERALIELKKLLDESGATRSDRSLSLQTSRSYIYEPFSRRG